MDFFSVCDTVLLLRRELIIMKRLWLLIILLMSTLPAWSDTLVLKSPVRAQQIDKSVDLGIIEIPGVGKVRFTARRKGIQVVINATGPDGTVLGRAETTIGLSQTPIHVVTPKGLKKVEIVWDSTGT